MLDGFLKPKFYSKCKSCAKLTKMRLDTIMKKRIAVQKFLKKDIADLLRNSLDYNAYGRAEGLFVEQNMSSCYELISKYIGCILENVEELPKKMECPEDCKEAVPSLIYAAARFSDLPELRDLRTLFTDKYGNSLERYLSKEFVQKLRQDPSSKEMKIQLLRDVAEEFAVLWDSKALEKRLYSPPQPVLHDDQASSGEERKSMKDNSSSLPSVSEDNEEVESKRPFSNRLVPPPYVREVETNLKKQTTDSESVPEKEASKDNNNNKAVPRSMRTRPRNPPPGYDTDVAAARVVVRDDDGGKNIRRSISTSPMSMRGTSSKDTITRTSSMETTLKGRGGSTAVHVHPSLPDYDDLSARLAALRAK